jgi:hypothetical protein
LAERGALATIALATVAFAIYGFATHAPSTSAYVTIVTIVGTAVVRLRQTNLPPRLVFSLAGLAVAHLAGGLVRVGHDVLYNAHAGNRFFQYDHFVHASGVLIGTLVVWHVFIAPMGHASRRADAVILCILAGLGLGALNETIEFAMTMLHHGAHVGGYENTGWDLVSNITGAMVAGTCIGFSSRAAAPAQEAQPGLGPPSSVCGRPRAR